MKIAVVAANGKAGKLVVGEAVRRGHDVTAVVRGENTTEARSAILKDIMSLGADDLADFDVVVDAFGAWTPETLDQHSATLAHLCDILSGTDTRLLVVGGAGSLYMNPEHTLVLCDTPISRRCSSLWPRLRARPSMSCVSATMSPGHSCRPRPISRPRVRARAITCWPARSSR